MNAWRNVIGCVLVWSAFAVPTAAAQKNDKQGETGKCGIDFGSNDQIKSAYNQMTVLGLSSGKPDDARKKIKSAISSLTSKSDFGKDQMARDAVLGQALVTWYDTPGSPPVAPAADLGYPSSAGQVDVLAAADSAFTAVETSHPDCADQMDGYRQQPWARLINQIGPLINGNKDDSAQVILNHAITIYPKSPYDYYFQGQLAQRKKDWQTAATAYSKAVELSAPDVVAKDTSVKAVKEFSEFSAAYAQLQLGQAASGTQQQDAMKKAADLYRQYLKDYPSGENAQPAQAGLTVALKASGDTASLGQMWKDMVANPTKYTDAQLFDAGTQAFTAQQYGTAVQLMEFGQKSNPYLRAGLFNLANAYWKNNQFDKMKPVADTLTKIDPDNPDNYQLLAIAYQGLEKGADPKQKKALADSVNKYVTAGDQLPVHVQFSQFTHDGDKYTLTGQVQNTGTKPETAALNVKFLDKTGQVVTSQSTSVQLGANETKQFTLNATGANIAAYRYDPIKP